MNAFGCVNNTIRLRSGHYLDLANPQPDQFTLEDIAGALSKICRFGGQCDYFYSVAEHSYLCVCVAERDGLPLDTQQAVLLHDAAESFIGDMVKPLKIMMPGYAEVEARVEAAIAEKFCIDFERERESIRKIDHEMLIAERRAMFSPDKVTWAGEDEVRRLQVDFQTWVPNHAEVAFMRLAKFIGIKE